MDEYLFIALAKLKADLRQFEPRRPESVSAPRVEHATSHRSPRARRSREMSAEILSVVPTHGLRGWS